jgi:hypothetical protein
MLNVRIKNTNKIKELEIIDPVTGCSWVADCLGNCDDLKNYDDETDTYEMDQDTFDFWENYLKSQQAADEAKKECRSNLANEKVEHFDCDISYAINQANEMIDQPSAIMSVVNEYTK